MSKLKWGGLKCAACGNNNMKLSVAYNGADWETVAGEGSGYGCSVALVCEECGRVYPICAVRELQDVTALLENEDKVDEK